MIDHRAQRDIAQAYVDGRFTPINSQNTAYMTIHETSKNGLY